LTGSLFVPKAAETRCDVPISRKAQVADPKPKYALLSQM